MVLSVRNLAVDFLTPDGDVHAVKDLSFELSRNETLAIVGESGSGKSQTAMAIMGLLPDNGRATGEVRFAEKDLLRLNTAELNKIRGRGISMIFQEPMTSLDPLYRIGDQLAEVIKRHQGLGHSEAKGRALELLRLVKINRAEERISAFPHELSGGQRQRVMIAMALANSPSVLIADEPTTALDVTIQAEIVALMQELQTRLGMAMIFISHDLNLVKHVAQRVIVMRNGVPVEMGQIRDVFTAPQHAYTKELLAAEPDGRKAPMRGDEPVVLDAQETVVSFPLAKNFWGRTTKTLTAVDGVNLTLRKGQTIGIVGESGSGKSTLARAMLRLLPSTGRIVFLGTDVSAFDKSTMRPLRHKMQVVLQDPFGSLNPRLTAGQIIGEGLQVFEAELSAQQRAERTRAAMLEVNLDPASLNRFPHEFSGGQRQRIAIARAMILKPDLVVLDEPTSALDRQVQKQIVELLRDLQKRYGLSYLFISHDLKVVRALADEIIVMKDGKVVERGPAETIVTQPQQDYTKQLMQAAFAE
jgi:ABC-type microcin C transport system duplicated ATPase subunit YejF